MPSHPKSHTFHQVRLLIFYAIFLYPFDGIVHGKNIVAVYLHAFHGIANGFIYQVFAAVLLAYWCAKAVTIVFYYKYYSQVPYGGGLQCFMKIAFAGAAIAAKSHGYFIFFF